MNIFKRVSKENPFEEQVNKELADSYYAMVQGGAWKDLDSKMNQIVKDSNSDVDNKPINELSVADVARARGMREAISRIRTHVYFYLNGK